MNNPVLKMKFTEAEIALLEQVKKKLTLDEFTALCVMMLELSMGNRPPGIEEEF